MKERPNTIKTEQIKNKRKEMHHVTYKQSDRQDRHTERQNTQQQKKERPTH